MQYWLNQPVPSFDICDRFLIVIVLYTSSWNVIPIETTVMTTVNVHVMTVNVHVMTVNVNCNDNCKCQL